MRTRIHYTGIALLLTGIFTLPGAALADQLVMKNGDIITGKITKLAGGRVFVEPAYADAYSVDVAEVASMDAGQTFEIELADGSIASGQIALDSAGRQAMLVDGAANSVDLANVVRAGEPEKDYERTSHADLNLTINSGNTDSKNTLLFADTLVRKGDHRHFADLTFRRDSTDGVKTKNQDLLRYNYNWLIAAPWYIGADASFERDPIKDLDYRYVIGVLAGRDFIKDDNRFLTASIGLGYSAEETFNVKDSGAVATWRMIYEHGFRGGALNFFHDNSITYQLFGDNNTIFKSNTGFRFDIVANVYANLSYRYDYETEPAPGASKDDSTLVVGIGSEF